ncbi:MAG: diguanylate cyclase [Oscillospiraceae bacterium]|nr:diguanylate cyclase [Oscillospiraceae bacterium]
MNLLISGILVFALLASTYIFVLAIKQHDSVKRTYFLLLIACVWVYVMGYLAEINSNTDEASFISHMVMYTGACFVAPLFLLFILDYTNYKIRISWVIILIGLTVANFLFAVTSQYHKLYYLSFWAEHSTMLTHFNFEPGPLYMPLHLVHYISVAIAVVILLVNFFRANIQIRSQASLLLIAGIVPVIGNVMFALRLNLFQGLNMTPLSMVLSIALFYICITKFNMFNLIPLASKQAIQSMQDIYIILDYNKCVFDVNPAAVEVFPELSNKTGNLAVGSINGWPEVLTETLDRTQVLSEAQTLHENVELLCDDENKHHYRASITSIFNSGNLLGWLVLLHNITDTVEMVNRLEQQATTDVLTGIHNRLFFMEHAGIILNECKRKLDNFSILLFDLDKFKSVNDSYGHSAGDAVLCSTVKLISETLRPYDLFARYGGEEFIIALSETDIGSVRDIAERIRIAMESHVTVFEEHSITRTISIGIAFNIDGSAKLQDIIDAADRALYTAKENGRNQIKLIEI